MPYSRRITPRKVHKRNAVFWLVRTPSDLIRDGTPGRRFFPTKDQAEDYAAALESARGTIASQFYALPVASQEAVLRVLARINNDGARLEQLVDFALKHIPADARMMVPAAVAEFIEGKRADGISAGQLRNYVATFQGGIEKTHVAFADAFPVECAALTNNALNAWLRSLPVSARTRNNKRRELLTFLTSIKARGYTKLDFMLDIAEEPAREISVLTPAELEKILRHGEDLLRACRGRKDQERKARSYRNALAFLTIGAFAGLRSAEIKRLHWEDVHFAQDLIEIRITATKRTRNTFPRNVQILPVLKAWLALLREKSGRVVNNSTVNLAGRITFAAIGRHMKNDRRHSFASYMTAFTGDESATATQTGHDRNTMRRSYRSPRFKTAAEAYLQIYPRKECFV